MHTEIQTYRLYVPKDPAKTGIDAGSAIVGEEMGEYIGVDYERGGASNVQTFEEKILHAAGRRAQKYPTVARSAYPPADLQDVGSVRYDPLLRRWVIESIDNLEALEAWAPGPHAIGGSDRLRQEAAGLLYSRMSSSGMTDVAMEHAAGLPMMDAILKVAERPGRLRS